MQLRQLPVVVVVVLASAMVAGGVARGEEPVDPARAVQGKWVRHQRTADGPLTIVKEHTGDTTTLTAYDAGGNVIYAHVSQYKVERTGKVNLFTFTNRMITAGPHAGEVVKAPSSFIVRVVDDQFFEVRGMLEGDDGAPAMIIWNRVAADADEKKDE